jgi:hypothetical protein
MLSLKSDLMHYDERSPSMKIIPLYEMECTFHSIVYRCSMIEPVNRRRPGIVNGYMQDVPQLCTPRFCLRRIQ